MRKLLETRPFDEIILATLPAGASRWLRMDLAHRMQRVTKLPVEEVAGEEPDAAEDGPPGRAPVPGCAGRRRGGRPRCECSSSRTTRATPS